MDYLFTFTVAIMITIGCHTVNILKMTNTNLAPIFAATTKCLAPHLRHIN